MTEKLPLAPEELVRAIYQTRLDRVHGRIQDKIVLVALVLFNLGTLAAIVFFALSP